MNLDKNQVYCVKIYFISPIDLISVIINTLIELEYESYTINENERDNLLKILTENIRNVLFFCVRNKLEVENWLKYVESVEQIKTSHVLIGAFVYDNMDNEIKNKFLEKNISVIEFSELKKNAINVMRNILTFFEAKGKRSYIRTKTYGVSEAYFYLKGKEDPIYAKITDVSAYAFSCEIDNTFKIYFANDTYFDEILFVFGGIRIRTAAKVLGFSKEKNNLYIMKFCTAKIDGDRIIFEDNISPEINHKLHDYIRKCLKDEITQKLSEIK